MAVADGADIVVGKVVGHGKYVPPGLFRRNLHNVSLHDAPLVVLLSPHKLFRRAFVQEHGLRFPEGRRRLEDHVFVLRAYFATERVSVLADYACYHWMRRGTDNASSGAAWDPVAYYAAVREVLDIVDEHTEPGPARDRLYLRWYRAKTLGRVGGSRSALTLRSPEWQRAVFAEVRAIVARALRPGARRAAAAQRAPAGRDDPRRRLRRGCSPRRGSSSGWPRAARCVAAEADGGGLRLRATARLRAGREPLPLAPADAAEVLEGSRAQLLIRALGSHEQHVVPATAVPRLRDGEVVFAVEATLDPRTAAAGAPLAAGDYDHPVVLTVGGFVGEGVLARRGAAVPAVTRIASDGTARARVTSARAVGLALARRLPRLAGAARRAGVRR